MLPQPEKETALANRQTARTMEVVTARAANAPQEAHGNNASAHNPNLPIVAKPILGGRRASKRRSQLMNAL